MAMGSDHREVTDLFYAYAWHFDRNEPAELAALFTDDATVDYGPDRPVLVGREQIEERVARGLREVFAATSHHISNVRVHVDGDIAKGVAYLYAWHRYHSGEPDGHLWAQYHDEFRRTADGWRISSLRLLSAGSVDFHSKSMHPIGRTPS
jgi:ketosteroid isomerase-like protein